METFPTRVRKRDGREESFDAVRLAASIQTALSSVNAEIGISTQLAEEVSGSTFCSATVETSELSALVETTLAEHDFQTAADAYRDFRQQAQHALQRVRIHTARGHEETSRPWDRRRLVVALMRDRHLESGLAGQVARRVERRVLGARLRHLTGRLVGSLADNECRTLGLRGDSLDAERVGLERRHLSAWLGGDCLPASDGSPSMAAPGQDPRPALGGQILARFAGQEILTASQAQGMADGLFELPTLGDWTRPARLLLRPSIGEDENAFWRRVSDELGRAHEVQVHWPAGRD
ncbi:MAG: ATP cone domain-containing protein, partial [Planctomycetes bacterium]|nr:ATP cone domain-containing protein [Planctomycetota bacterium]